MISNVWQRHHLHCTQHRNYNSERLQKHLAFAAEIFDAVKKESH